MWFGKEAKINIFVQSAILKATFNTKNSHQYSVAITNMPSGVRHCCVNQSSTVY